MEPKQKTVTSSQPDDPNGSWNRIALAGFILLSLALFLLEFTREESLLIPDIENGQQLHIQASKLPFEVAPKSEVQPSSSIKPVSREPSQWLKETVVDLLGPSAYLQNGGVISQLDPRFRILCKLNVSRRCMSNYIADSIDLVVTFAPIYALNQTDQEDLYNFHDNFLGLMKTTGIQTQVIEAIDPSKGQVYLKTRAGKEPWEIQVTISDAFYYRENLLNVAARKTIDLWEYIFWIDAHQVFGNTYWWEEAIYQAERVNAVHLTEKMQYREGNNHTTWFWLPTVTYIYKFRTNIDSTSYFAGNGWAMRKEIYKKIDHIIDECVAAACDYALVMSLMKSDDDWPAAFAKSPYYYEQLKPLIAKQREILEGSYATIRGPLNHFEHTHFFQYWKTQEQFAGCCIDINTDMWRDDNFTLHSTNKNFTERFSTKTY